MGASVFIAICTPPAIATTLPADATSTRTLCASAFFTTRERSLLADAACGAATARDRAMSASVRNLVSLAGRQPAPAGCGAQPQHRSNTAPAESDSWARTFVAFALGPSLIEIGRAEALSPRGVDRGRLPHRSFSRQPGQAVDAGPGAGPLLPRP